MVSKVTSDTADAGLPEATSVECVEIERETIQCTCYQCDPKAYERKCREEEEEWERERRIRTPWLYETQKAMIEPPDINYRELIIRDQEEINRLLEDKSLHFTERCLQYQRQDVDVERKVLWQYKDWAEYMLDDATESGDQTREKLFQELAEVLHEDYSDVSIEWYELYQGQNLRERRRIAQELGIPSDHEEWTTEDELRYFQSKEYVRRWPRRPENEKEDSLDLSEKQESADDADDSEEQQSENGSYHPTKDAEDSDDTPQVDNIHEHLSASNVIPATPPPNQDNNKGSVDLVVKFELKPHTTEPQSFSINAKFPPKQRAFYHRAFALLLLVLLIYELVKQKLRL